jgi:3,4-dihydroxy 2-butanone 4-phosphate synthase/GTP cyclohydrolase II
MARVPQLVEFCARHGVKMISVAELIRYRMKHEAFLRRVAEGCVETEFGEFHAIAYASQFNPEYHVALVRGEVAGKERVLVRMHSRCMFGDVFHSTSCGCGQLIRNSLRAIAGEGAGVLVYLHETGPGFGVERGPRGEPRIATHSRDFSHYRGEAGERQLQHEHGIGAQILSDLGLHTVRLLTNHPRKIVALEGFGIEIVGQEPVGE